MEKKMVKNTKSFFCNTKRKKEQKMKRQENGECGNGATKITKKQKHIQREQFI